DLMQIQSVPQAFYWVKSAPEYDRGEPHTCEHLLLGKGSTGRYVAGLEDMRLGSSTAYTGQTHTCYHFNTKGGDDTFFELFEAKLNALCNPDFTDEEIRREVCHVGVVVDQTDGTLSLDEKGTVYTEMVSSFEKHWYYLWGRADNMIYGSDHPLSNNAGGIPSDIRTMTAQNLRDFHQTTHHLANIGVIVSIPDNIDVTECLTKFDQTLNRIQPVAREYSEIGISAFPIPPASPDAPAGTVEVHGYPSENPQDPAHVLMVYPANIDLNNSDRFMLDLFLSTFASGQTSNLYNLFINSETKVMDLGGNGVFGYFSEDRGNPIYFGLSGLTSDKITVPMLDSAKSVIKTELSRIYNMADGSDELAEFNKKAAGHLASNQKQTEQYLNSPPMFGFRRGVASGWLSLLQRVEAEPGFSKSLVSADHFATAETHLAGTTNFWKEFIERWQIVQSDPVVVGVVPDDGILKRNVEEKDARIAGYIDGFKKKYGVDDDQAAIAAYKAEFDANTAELDQMATGDELPQFMTNPPLSLDEQLKYETVTLPGDIEMVASTFENMTSSTIGICLRLDVIPADKLIYVPALSSVMTDIGVTKDGETIAYDDMSNRLRNEVLNLNAYLDYDYQTERVEIILRGAGSNIAETKTAIGWMNAALFSPYLDTENLPRLRDLVDQGLIGLRNTMKGSEESWVRDPADAYLYQHNPLLLSADNFLTQTHHLLRIKFRLMDAGDDAAQAELAGWYSDLENMAA
ncbi:MAG: hypothetical protein V3T31_05845, partial [candidate division Zixibacteria bacterium]